MEEKRDNPGAGVLSRGWFAVLYWSVVALGVAAVILSFTLGTGEQRILTGGLVMGVVIALLVVRGLIVRHRQRVAQGDGQQRQVRS